MSDYVRDIIDPDPRPGIDAGRLWRGGVAAAVVAALLAVVGVLIARGLFGVAVLALNNDGMWSNVNIPTYAVVAAVAALMATGLMHLLSLATLTPGQFFGWIMVLITVIMVVLPLTLTVETGTKIATALINLVLCLAIAMIVSNMAASARTLHRRKRAYRLALNRQREF
jgi:hypothetical protein